MKKPVLLSILICLGATSLFAQKVMVSGSLHDETSNAPLPYSNIIILNAEDSVMNGGMTGKDGGFKLDVTPDEAMRLEASGLGYKKQSFPLVFAGKSDIDLGKIYLERDSLVLDEVDVGAQNTVVQKFDRKVYSIKENKKAAARDIYDLLRTLPGVTVDKENNIRFKGATPSVMVDDMPAEYLYPDLAMIPVDNVQKIELIDAAMRSGGDGKGGIINIRLKKATSDGLSGVFSVRGGTGRFDALNQGNAYVNLNYKKGKWLFFNNMWTYHHISENETEIDGELTTDNYVLSTQDFNENRYRMNYLSEYLGAQWNITDNSKLVMAAGINSHTFNSTSTSHELSYMNDSVFNDYMINSESQGVSVSGRSYVYFVHRFDTTLREFNAWLSYSSPELQQDRWTRREYSYNVMNMVPAGYSDVYRTQMINNNTGLYTGMYYNHPISEKSRWNARYRGSYNQIIDERNLHYQNGVFIGPQSLDKSGISNSHSLSFRYGTTLGKFKLDAGIKGQYKNYTYDYDMTTQALTDTSLQIDVERLHVLPSTTVQFTIDSLQDVKLSYSRTARVPWSDYFLDFVEKHSPVHWSAGNPDLESSVYNNVYLGYSINKPMWNAAADLFYNQTNNEIANVSYPVNDVILLSIPENIAFQARWGLDLSSYYAVSKKISFNFSASLYHSKIDATSLNESMDEMGIPASDIVKRNYGMTAKLSSTISFENNFSSMIYLNYASREVEVDSYEYPDMNLKLSLTKHFFERKLMVSIAGSQLLGSVLPDRTHYDYAGRVRDNLTVYSTGSFPMLLMSVRYRFRQGDRNTSRIGQGMDS